MTNLAGGRLTDGQMPVSRMWVLHMKIRLHPTNSSYQRSRAWWSYMSKFKLYIATASKSWPSLHHWHPQCAWSCTRHAKTCLLSPKYEWEYRKGFSALLTVWECIWHFNLCRIMRDLACHLQKATVHLQNTSPPPKFCKPFATIIKEIQHLLKKETPFAGLKQVWENYTSISKIIDTTVDTGLVCDA